VLLLCVIWLIMAEIWAKQPFKAEKPARTRRFMASKANQLQMHSRTHLPAIKGNHSTTQCKINRKQPTMGEKLETCLRFSRCLLWRWKWHDGGSAGGIRQPPNDTSHHPPPIIHKAALATKCVPANNSPKEQGERGRIGR